MVDFGRIQDAVIYEAVAIATGSLIASVVWFIANYFGYNYAVTAFISIGCALMMTVYYDNKQLSSNPSARTCTYEGLACFAIFLAIMTYLGFSTFSSGPGAPSSFPDILRCAVSMSSIISFARTSYFTLILISRWEIPDI